MTVTIGPACLSDTTYIGANLRPADRAEILCQFPAGMTGSDAAAAMLATVHPGWTWIAALDRNPACLFGFQPYNAATWIGFAFGTRRMLRTIPAVTRHCIAQEQRLLDLGARRVEVRSMAGHDIAQAWLTRLGCIRECVLPDFGRDGEPFELWSWSLSRGRPTETMPHVFQRAQATASATGSEPV